MPTGIYKHKPLSEEHKRKISEAHKGKKHTAEHNRKTSEGRKGIKFSEETKRRMSKAHRGKKLSEEHRKKIGESNMGRIVSKETRRKIGEPKKGKPTWNKGKHLTEEWKRKLSLSHKGVKSYLWKGGISFEPYGLEFNKELKEQIRKRDNYTCQECDYTEKELGYILGIHHIDYNKKNNKPSNLISLCRNCHSQTGFRREDWTKYFLNRGGFCA